MSQPINLYVLVNQTPRVTADQSTASLCLAALRRGHRVRVVDVRGLGMEPDDRVAVSGVALSDGAKAGVEALVAQLRAGPRQAWTLVPGDVVLIRSNPARDPDHVWAHDAALELAQIAQEQGVVVLSDPRGLQLARSKLYLSTLPPEVRPRTLVSQSPARIREFVTTAPGPCVLKPLRGTHGRDVFMVDAADRRNLQQILSVLTRDGLAMAQDFVPEATQGDVRLLLLDGELLTANGRAAAVRRVPGPEDFRSNVHAGGHAEAVPLSPTMLRVARAVGPRLKRDGLFLVGLDLIGAVVVEVNVFAPGGLHDAGAFAGVNFEDEVIAAIEARVP